MIELGLKSVSEDLILERLKFENPWWASGNIDSDFEAACRLAETRCSPCVMPRARYWPMAYPY